VKNYLIFNWLKLNPFDTLIPALIPEAGVPTNGAVG
jgi:hypothetical protein